MAWAVAVRALAERSSIDPNADPTLPKAPGGTGSTGSPSQASGSSGRERPPERGTLVIHGTGDVSLDPNYIPAFRTQGYGWVWSGLSGLFRRDDLTVINLE